VAVAGASRASTPQDRADKLPAQSTDGSLILVGDLRLDNRDQLAAPLRLSDDLSTPDSAFVLAAYERWGERFLNRIYGDFALAIVDRHRGGVLVARDHLGRRPLVIHERPGVVAFASTALALTAFEGVGHGLDVERAVEVLALAYTAERTFVQGVRWVPPATAIWIEAGRTRRWDWWSPDPNVVDLGTPALHELELREALDRSVAARMRTLGRVGADASGGLDSTSVAATAARAMAPDPLPTYTSAPPPGWEGGESEWDPDESPLVLKLAALHRNITPRFVHIQPGVSLFALHEPLWELGAGPSRNPCNMLWVQAIAQRAAADGVTTMLSGERGNMYFSRDGPRWLVSLLAAGRVVPSMREAATWSRTSGESPYRILRNHVVSPLLPGPVRRLVRAAIGREQPRDAWLASTALRPEVGRELDLERLVPWLDERWRADPRAPARALLRGGASQAETRAAMAALTGVEDRDPTGDRRVLEVALRQPEWVRRHHGRNRAVARGAMADRLPAEIVYRTRRGDQLPDWLDLMTAARTDLAIELDALVEHPLSRELIDTQRLQRLFVRWPERTERAAPAVVRDYRLALFRALLVSRYLRWFEARAASASHRPSQARVP
jgi:asparagine synthase (glutamine-hydrolysing)